jgi:hypothetical protein
MVHPRHRTARPQPLGPAVLTRLVAALILLGLALAPSAHAQAVQRPPSLDEPPRFHRLTGNQVIAIADRNEKIRDERRKFPGSTREVFTKGPVRWQVSYFSRGRKKEIGQVTLDDRTGAVIEAWTGFRVPWTMARGYDGAFGRKVNAPYVWIPLLVLFLVPFVDPRRWRQLFHLDLLVLCAFSASLAWFTAGKIEWSVPTVYPLLVYLLGRMLWVGLSRDRPREAPRLLLPTDWMLIGIIFLLGFRLGLNLTSSNVIDVGYAGVVGADKIADGAPLYGGWPTNNQHGDTYGPVNYLAYLPFEQLLPWSGEWDDLPAAHAAALVFDVLTVIALWLLGRRVAGQRLGVALAYAWTAFPFTLYVSNSNANDALVPLLLVVMLLVASKPLARGVATAVAGLTKFAPLALAPLFALQDSAERGMSGDSVRRTRKPSRIALFVLGFVVTAAALLLAFVDDAGLFWDRTLGFQADRNSPFSLWGLHDLDVLQRVVQGGAVLLALVVAVIPRRRDVVGLAALSAAVLIALQLGVEHWFYLYVVWFFPLVMLALLAPGAKPAEPARSPLREEVAVHSGSALP